MESIDLEKELKSVREKKKVLDDLNELFTSLNKEISESGEIAAETVGTIEKWFNWISGANSWKTWIRDDGDESSHVPKGPETLQELERFITKIVSTTSNAAVGVLDIESPIEIVIDANDPDLEDYDFGGGKENQIGEFNLKFKQW